MSGHAKSPLLLPLAVVFFLGLVPVPLSAQTVGEVKGFKLAEPYDAPYQEQIKSLLQGAKARTIANGEYLLTDAKVQSFRTNHELEMVVQAPQCFYSSAAHSASSAGPLRVQTADGKYSIEGVGFLWRQTNTSLFISNQVHTVVLPELLETKTSNARTNASDPGSPLEIFSDAFEYAGLSGQGVYRGNVRAVTTNLSLTGGTLTVQVPRQEGGRPSGLERITAEREVSIDYTNETPLHATGQRAVYSTATGLLRLSGKPAWRADPRHGHGDELVIDRTNKIFQANSNAFLRMPGQSLGVSGFLSKTNAAKPARDPAERFMEIRCDSYEFRTNLAVFRNKVRVTDLVNNAPKGKMSCSLLTATFGRTNELQTLTAETNVVIEEEDKRFTAGKALYTGTNSVLELTKKPGWQEGARRGGGNLIRVTREEILVRSNAWMQLPAEQLAETSLPGPGGSATKSKTKPGESAEIFANEYTARSDGAVFLGAVRAKHPRMNLSCERLTVKRPPGLSRMMVAEKGVAFDLMDEKGQTIHGTGANVVYTYSVTGQVTNDVVELRGNPAMLQMTNTMVENSVILFDRVSNKLRAPPGGEYKFSGMGPAIPTNMFVLPKSKGRK